MDDDKGDDGFEGFFPFFGGFDRHFKDMTRQMEEMSRQFEEMFKDGDIKISFQMPTLSERLPPLDGRPSPLREDPRDQMLKDDPRTETSNSTQITPISSQSKNGRFWSWNNSELFSELSNPNTTITGRMKSVKTIRHSDGSMERIEKTTENGRTCTTVTKTDPNGVSTTTTTCDRPGLENGPQDIIVPSLPCPPQPAIPDISQSSTPPLNTQLTKEDEGFFRKLFGNFVFGKSR